MTADGSNFLIITALLLFFSFFASAHISAHQPLTSLQSELSTLFSFVSLANGQYNNKTINNIEILLSLVTDDAIRDRPKFVQPPAFCKLCQI